MIAVYAMGGGLGHLARARRVLQALGCASGHPGQARIFTASPYAADEEGVVRVPRRLARSPREFGAWLKENMHSLAPSAVVVDAFPLGILGELADPTILPEVPLFHVARLLKWDAYRSAFAGTPRKYQVSFTVEELGPEHREFLAENSERILPLELSLNPGSQTENPFRKHSVWLIVHSGRAAEVRTLLEFSIRKARAENATPNYVVVTPRAVDLPEGVQCISHARPWELYPHAARIVTACGFNSMREAAPWRGKHLYLPLERRFDDQALRAQRAGKC